MESRLKGWKAHLTQPLDHGCVLWIQPRVWKFQQYPTSYNRSKAGDKKRDQLGKSQSVNHVRRKKSIRFQDG